LQDYEITIADTGNQAIIAACLADSDLILMDVEMRGMNGLEANQAIQLGAKDYTRQPFPPSGLIDSVSCLLSA
jgi:CheY-like chemotaxis protein